MSQERVFLMLRMARFVAALAIRFKRERLFDV